MLPSRAIARSLPPAAVGRRLQGRRATTNPSSAVLSAPSATARRFGTLPRGAGGRASTCSPAPLFAGRRGVVLGAVSAPRAFSLWGYGRSSTPPAPADAAAAATAQDAAAARAATAPAPAVGPVDATPGTPVPAAPPTEPAVAASDVDLSSIADLVNANDILGMPEDLGYLHAIGLDYGWGPTSLMQWTLEHVHVWTGLGWGASIVATAFVLRCAMFYPQVRALQFGAIMHKMKQDPRSQEAMKLVQQGFQDRDTEMRQRGQILNKMLRQQYGVSNWGIAWSLMQIPFTFGLFRIVSGMTHIPVPSMETGGYLWFPDLTATDPYFLLPAIGTGLMVVSVLLNAKHSPASQQKLLKPMMYAFGVVGFFGTTFLSSAVNLMTVSVGASTLASALVLNNGRLRRFLDLPTHGGNTISKSVSVYAAPRAPPVAEPAAEPAAPAGLRERLTNNLDDVKKGFSEQVSNLTGTYTGTDQEKAARKRKDLLRRLESTRMSQEREEFAKKYKKKQ